jgi:hypothetical protein
LFFIAGCWVFIPPVGFIIYLNRVEKKEENNLDNYYEDSIFSVTEDVQYPLFDAEKAKEGIFSKEKRPERKKPNIVNQNSEKSKFLTDPVRTNTNDKNFKFNDVFESEIKIDEPLPLMQDHNKIFPPKPSNTPLFPQTQINNLALLNPQGERKMSARRGPFRPQPK